ncbi:hypothetical protein [Streptomyces sp. NPDC057616]|uniref:hypothetical protein n=1 Tax=Streptomyces sp. NPDC057616 TaxID=3346183 RepID=UPI0036BE19BD
MDNHDYDYAAMAGWARERLVAVRDATPAPGGDVKELALEVADVYEELAAILPLEGPTGDPRRWSGPAVVKAGAAVIGVLDELRNPQGPGNKRDLPELFFAASVERTLTGSPAGVEAACVSALTGDAEHLWAKAFSKLLVYAISVPVVGLVDDLTGMLAEAVAARRWMNLQRQLATCAKELTRPPDATRQRVEAPTARPDHPGQAPRQQPDAPAARGLDLRRRGPWRRMRAYGAATPPSTGPDAPGGPLSPPPTPPPPSPKAVPGRKSVTPPPSDPRRRPRLPAVPQVEEPTPPTPNSVDRRKPTIDHPRRVPPSPRTDPPKSRGVSRPNAPGM